MDVQVYLLKKGYMINKIMEYLGPYSIYDYDIYNKKEILFYSLKQNKVAIIQLINKKITSIHIKYPNGSIKYIIQ